MALFLLLLSVGTMSYGFWHPDPEWIIIGGLEFAIGVVLWIKGVSSEYGQRRGNKS